MAPRSLGCFARLYELLTMKKAFIKGYKAGIGGAKGGSNPYHYSPKQYQQWDKGWVSAFIDSMIDKKVSKRIPKSF
jgi:ribosome modulation factor